MKERKKKKTKKNADSQYNVGDETKKIHARVMNDNENLSNGTEEENFYVRNCL